MISISKLLYDLDATGDGLRYGAASDAEQIRERRQQRPVVVWNTTKQCNLSCAHCYAGADRGRAPGELSTAEAKAMLDELAAYGVPVVLFSGGEPLVREDLTDLVAHASDAGLRPVLSTNGTLLTRDRARELREAGLAYAGISVDGTREVNDAFRGKDGAFDAAVEGIRACLDVGLKTGLRYTVTEDTVGDMADVVDLLTDVGVDRFCFYHLAYGGRGVPEADISPERRREAITELVELTREYHEDGAGIETLLVGNYCDAAYLVEYAREAFGPERAERVRRYLERNGGDPAGERVADIDYLGNVHATQFWQSYSLGNVRDRPFGAIWDDESNPLLRRLRDRPDSLGEQCRDCAHADICRGASRLRALAVTGDIAATDPQCYLTPAERGAPGADGASGPSTAD